MGCATTADRARARRAVRPRTDEVGCATSAILDAHSTSSALGGTGGTGGTGQMNWRMFSKQLPFSWTCDDQHNLDNFPRMGRRAGVKSC